MIKNNLDILGILSNPLSLSLSLALFLFKNILPNDSASLINELSYFFTEIWDEKRSIRRYNLLSPKTSRFLLGKLSYELKRDDQFTFNNDYFRKILPKRFKNNEVADILTELKETTGLITYHRGTWSFTHKYFQDFFCANFLIDKSGSIENDFTTFKNENRWLNVWNNAIELSNDPEFYLNLQNTNKESSFYNLNRLSSILLSEKSITYLDNIDISEYLLASFKEFDNYISKVIIEVNKLSITLKKGVPVEINDIGILIIQFYILNKIERISLSRLIRKEPKLKIFQLFKGMIQFSEVPKLSVSAGKITLINNTLHNKV